MFVTTTIAVVYWTVFVQGITIKPLVKFLNVKTANEKVGDLQRFRVRHGLSCVIGPVWPVGAGCYSQAALPMPLSKPL